MYYDEDIKGLEYMIQKDLKVKVKKFITIKRKGTENQLFLRRLIQRNISRE